MLGRGHRAGPRISRNSEKEPDIETAAATKQLWSLQNYYFLPHLLFCICSGHAADDCLKIVLLYSNDSYENKSWVEIPNPNLVFCMEIKCTISAILRRNSFKKAL